MVVVTAGVIDVIAAMVAVIDARVDDIAVSIDVIR